MDIKYINRATGEVELEKPPAEGLLRFIYDNPLGRATLLPLVKRKLITKLYGKKMSSPSSTKKIQQFVNQLNIDMSESLKSVDEFTSFNDFFYRKLKPGSRPISSGLISPGDGKALAFKKATEINNLYIKGRKFTIKEFLNNDQLAAKYANASMIILRLAPNDYHRYHFPYSGTPSPSVAIKGAYYSVSPYALVSNFTKVFCENKREICTLHTADKGNLLLVPIGATMVGSIHATYKPNQPVNKGDEMGYFSFGGSTIVLLFDPAYFEINPDLLLNTKNKLETFIKMGEQIAQPI